MLKPGVEMVKRKRRLTVQVYVYLQCVFTVGIFLKEHHVPEVNQNRQMCLEVYTGHISKEVAYAGICQELCIKMLHQV